MSEWIVDGINLIDSGPKLNGWRAATDNDGFKAAADWRFDKDLYEWKKAGLNNLEHTTETLTAEQTADQQVKVTLQTIVGSENNGEAFVHQHTYTINGDGSVRMNNDVQVNVQVRNLPRVGVSLSMPAGFETFEWFGRGPHENYRDRNAGAPVGRYSGSVDDQYVPYIMPQTNGNKTDVRQIWLTNESGHGLTVRAEGVMEASATHISEDDLFQAMHTNQLTRLDETIVHLDHLQAALGGASCGPNTLEAYWIRPDTYSFTFEMRPIRPDKDAQE